MFVVRACEKAKENRASAMFRGANGKKEEVNKRAKPQRQAEP